jgi:hypothetical protein
MNHSSSPTSLVIVWLDGDGIHACPSVVAQMQERPDAVAHF